MLWGWPSKGESWRPARGPVIMYDSDLGCQHRKGDPVVGTRHSGSLATGREGSSSGVGVQEYLSELYQCGCGHPSCWKCSQCSQAFPQTN